MLWRRRLTRSARGALLLFAAITLALHLLTASNLSYHEDELYYLDSSQHLQLGYVDFPPLTPLLARLATTLVGNSLIGLRLFPALAGAAVVVLAGLIARELGGTALMRLPRPLLRRGGSDRHYGAALGIPHAFSPHLTYWYWKPAITDAATVLAVGYTVSEMERVFKSVRRVGVLHNAESVHSEAWGLPLLICQNPIVSLDTAWASLRDFSYFPLKNPHQSHQHSTQNLGPAIG